MDGKTGGAVAIGTVVVAVSYMTAGFRSESPPGPPPASSQVAASSAVRLAGAPQKAQRPYDMVNVFYATDRALAKGSAGAWEAEVRVAGLLTGLGMLAFAAWFARRGQKASAIATASLALAAAVVLGVLLPWLAVRNRLAEPGLANGHYGGERGELQMGYCAVSIPHSHQVGEFERPSILHLELRARPDRHLMLQQVVHQEEQAFYEAVRQRVEQSPRHDLFVFVHGFNVSFESAARRTAQMAYDLKYAGAPIFFSWPSQGKTWEYTVDETNVTWSVPHLKRFLTELTSRCRAESIHLIAHSMGNRALTQAICELGYECRQDKKLFQQVVLAAPDIDADVFREQIAPVLARHASQVTLYASSSDEALAASKLVHGSRRAGDTEVQPVVVPGIETIDVAATELGPLGHSYYGSCPLILQDLAAILRESRAAAQRPWLARIGLQQTQYWRLADAPSVANVPVAPARSAH